MSSFFNKNIDTSIIHKYIIRYKLDIDAEELAISLKAIDIDILLREQSEKAAEFTLVRGLPSYRVSVIATLYYNKILKN